MKRRRRVRTIDGDDVHAGEHLVETLPISSGELLLDLARNATPIVVMDLQPECAGAARHPFPDAAHPNDAPTLTPDAVPDHPSLPPARPRFVLAHHRGALRHTAR